jgi:peptidoglycan/xylan/chitin deacetylase (PgdA/CDA1 family)
MEASVSPDVATAQLAKEIQEAGEALLKTAEKEPDTWRPAYELKDETRNGWTAGAMSIALNRLVDEGKFESKGDLIRLTH